MNKQWGPRIAALASALVALIAFPRWWCGRQAERLARGEADVVAALGRGVARQTTVAEQRPFATGSERFDGEWRFGTALMAALGFGQTAIGHPELAAFALTEMDRALGSAMSPGARQFDRSAWSEDALARLEGGRGHAAYLGYLNLALSLRRAAGGRGVLADWNDRLSAELVRRYARWSTLCLETYPGERYPVDNAAAIASVALWERVTQRAPSGLPERWISEARRRFVEPDTGLLYQAVDAEGRPTDRARGSGTCLAAYFLSFSGSDFSGALHAAVRRELAADVLGFGVIREYGRLGAGRGDVDSGPLVLGWSISAMGFGLGSARAHGDDPAFEALYRSFHLLGAPSRRGRELSFVSGGPLGDAILFAMVTALPVEHWRVA